LNGWGRGLVVPSSALCSGREKEPRSPLLSFLFKDIKAQYKEIGFSYDPINLENNIPMYCDIVLLNYPLLFVIINIEKETPLGSHGCIICVTIQNTYYIYMYKRTMSILISIYIAQVKVLMKHMSKTCGRRDNHAIVAWCPCNRVIFFFTTS